MSTMYLLVHRILEAGSLSPEQEAQLRKLLKIGCSNEDMEALLMLKQALVFGHVKRQPVTHPSRHAGSPSLQQAA